MNLFKLLLLLTFTLAPLFSAVNDEAIEKIRLIWHQDPAHHAVLAWSGPEGVVHYGKKGEELSQQTMITRSTNAKGMKNRFVHLKNLTANQDYACIIKSRNASSKEFWFRTAPDSKSAFAMVAGGDSRNHRDARCRANTMVKKLRPLFVAFGGDMTNRDTDKEWQDWFDDWQLTIGDDGRLIPIVAARGNHERDNLTISNLFNSPDKNIYYTTSIGKDYFRLYTLNSEIEPGGAQAEWLANDLKTHGKTHWKLAQYHKPMRPHVRGKREGIDRYRAWAPLFYQHGFNLVMESDSHCVKSTWPIRPSLSAGHFEGFIRDDKRGTVFIGEGCWGAPLRKADDRKPWTRDAASFNQIKWIHVHPDRIEARTIAVDTVESVGTVDDQKPFTAPENLGVWQGENGPVITLKPFGDTPIDASTIDELSLIDVKVDIKADSNLFPEKATITVSCNKDNGGTIHYTIDGSLPKSTSPVYKEPFQITETTMIHAALITADNKASMVSKYVAYKIPKPKGTRGPQPEVFVDSLEWTSQSAGWGVTQKNKSVGGGGLRIAGVNYKHGLGMHSPGHVTYNCDPSWKRFVATVGLTDRARGDAQADLRILADDKEIYKSPNPFIRFEVHHINVAIPDGCKEIKIIAGDGGNGPGWDNVDLVDAGFLKQ